MTQCGRTSFRWLRFAVASSACSAATTCTSLETLRDITASGRRNETPAASGMSLKDVGGVDRDIDIETS